MEFDYPYFVKREHIHAIFDYDRKRRYLLTIPFSEKPTKSILIILKNPSEANEYKSDMTVKRVIMYVKSNLSDINNVIIANLFVYCSKNPQEINKKLNEISEDYVTGNDSTNRLNNNNKIKEAAKQASKIIIAWGNSNGIKGDTYNRRVKEIFDLLKEKQFYYVRSKSKKGNPLHGQMWSYKYKLLKWKQG
jgi:hypothetical protein